MVRSARKLDPPLASGRLDYHGLAEAKAGFRSLTETINTTTPAGRMMMQMAVHLLNSSAPCSGERTKAGLDAARQDGIRSLVLTFERINVQETILRTLSSELS